MTSPPWWPWAILQQLISAAEPVAAPPVAAPSSTQIFWLLGVVIGLLAIAYAVSVLLKRYPEGTLNPALVERFIHRIRIWWIMCAILVAGFLLGCCLVAAMTQHIAGNVAAVDIHTRAQQRQEQAPHTATHVKRGLAK